MTVEQDYDALADRLNRENIREEAALGRNLEDLRLQLRVLARQRIHRRGYRPGATGGTGPTGASGPAS